MENRASCSINSLANWLEVLLMFHSSSDDMLLTVGGGGFAAHFSLRSTVRALYVCLLFVMCKCAKYTFLL